MLTLEAGRVYEAIQGLWESSNVKMGAVAYVSSDELMRFGAGDLLVTDASDNSIAQGRTSAKVLSAAVKRGARVFSLSELHAKLVVLDHHTVCGSANLSVSAAEKLFEAVLISDDPALRSRAVAVLDELTRRARLVDRRFLSRISKIPVSREGGGAPNSGRATKISPLEALRSAGPERDCLSFLFYGTGSDLTTQKVAKIAHRHGVVLPANWKKDGDWLTYRSNRGKTIAWFRKYQADLEAKSRDVLLIKVSSDKKGTRVEEILDVERNLYRHYAIVENGKELVQYLSKSRNRGIRLDAKAARELKVALRDRLSSSSQLQKLSGHPTWLLSPNDMRKLLGL